MSSIVFLNCPHCNDLIEIHLEEANCKIYRHAVYKDTYVQIDPHMKKENIDQLLLQNAIVGCGKPFQLIIHGNECRLIECDYI